MASDGSVSLASEKGHGAPLVHAQAEEGSAGGAAAAAARAEAVSNATQAVTHAAQVGLHAAEEGVTQIMRYIQTHHWSTSALCLVGGFATIISGLVGLIDISPLQAISRLYLVMFGLVTIMLEVDVDQLQKYPSLSSIQGLMARKQLSMHRECHFLTGLKGRGMFYVFVGLFALSLSGVFAFLVGAYNLFIGVLCIVTAVRAGPRYPTAAGQMSQPLRTPEQDSQMDESLRTEY
jgi:uncharacterized membrane protein HdeD (DUF308 family)